MAMTTPGILSGLMSDGAMRAIHRTGRARARTARFVTQSHVLGTRIANPRALVIAGLIAVALVMAGRRLSE